MFRKIVMLFFVAFIATACSANLPASPAPADTAAPPVATAAPAPTDAPTATPAEAAMEPAETGMEATTEPSAETPIAFDATAAEEEGYWYSRYNLGNLVMRSGLGEMFMPEPEMVMAMVGMVDANPDDGDTAVPPTNPALLKAVFAGGDPHLTVKLDPADYATQRWDPASFDTTVTTRALGWTILKETEWGKQFHVDNHFGAPQDPFGAQQRFAGMVLMAEAKMQAQYALQMLKNEQGLFLNSDGALDYAGNWVLLEAFSDLGGALDMPTLPHSASNRYYNPDQSAMFLGAADMLFGALADRQPEGIEETSLALQALAWYAANSASEAGVRAALDAMASFGTQLAAAEAENAAGNAFIIRGLMEAYRLTGDSAFLDAAAAAFGRLTADFNPGHGIFDSQHTYTIDDVGVIMGALNSLKFYAGEAVNQAAVRELFARFFRSAVNESGLQQAVPPVPVAKGAFEQDEPEIFYGYPALPKPPMAGGEFGIAPVFAAEVSFDMGAWTVTNRNFDTAGAMHASNEFIWFHNDEVNGFPELP